MSDLQIDWLVEPPVIDVITDFGSDQGRQVSLKWTGSAHDFAGDSLQVVEFAVYRKIDPNLSKAAPALAARGRGEFGTALSCPMQAALGERKTGQPARPRSRAALVSSPS